MASERSTCATPRSAAPTRGVFVAPVFGESLELYWDDADLQQAERLAEAFRNVQERDTGDLSDVPSELHQAREPRH